MKKLLSISMILLGLLLQAQDSKFPIPQISVTGEGKVKVIPDQAIVSVGFQNKGKDAREVKNHNDEVVDNVIKVLKKYGVSDSDYNTENVYLNKVYEYDKKIYLFQADQTLRVTFKNLKKYDEIMTALYESGINTINGIEFKSSKQEELEREARKKAMIDAKQKATDYTSVLGQKVGKAILITDASQPYNPRPIYAPKMMALAVSDDSSRETMAVGEMEIMINVSVTFSLE